MLSEYSFTKDSSLVATGTIQNDAVQYIQTNITPVINWATNWGMTAGFLMLGVALFYQVVIILVKPDK